MILHSCVLALPHLYLALGCSRFVGWLETPQNGDYSFKATCSDGCHVFLGGRGRDNVEYKDLKLKQYNRNVARTATSLVGEVKMALLRGRSDLRPQGLQSCRPEPRPEEHPSGAAGMQPLRPKLHTLPLSSRFPLSKGNMGARMALTLVLIYCAREPH